MNGWVDIYNCPVCNGLLRPHQTVFTAPSLVVDFCGGLLPLITPSSFVECTVCGLVIQSPRMTARRIEQYYSSGLYRATLGLSEEAMDADEKRRSLDVKNWLDLRPASHADIGASRGYLLQEISAPVRRGYDTNPAYAKTAQITDDKLAWEQYELVTAVHVLEHTLDPLFELGWYKSLVSGTLYIEVPGKNCKGGPLRFAHLYYFPPEWLCNKLEEMEFRIVRTEFGSNTRILCCKK